MDGEYDYDEAVEALKCVFGIVGICPVVILEDEGFDKLAEEVIHHIDEAYPDKHFTFKVMREERAKIIRLSPWRSMHSLESAF